MAKTIVFCVDQEHAARMRQALINENADLIAKNARYVMRITGNDKDGIDQLGNFIDPEATYPVIVTTSKLLSTGVDAQTCRLIVLDREVGSMTEFKQIVGRGTRVHEDTRKLFFTLMDFRGASSHFADPDFDGEPVQIYQPGPDDPVTPPDETSAETADGVSGNEGPANETVLIDPNNQNLTSNTKTGPRPKVYIDGVGADIVAERVEYLDENGKLVTESLRDYTRKAMRQRFTSLDDFLKSWKQTERKHALVEELAEEGLPLDVIADELGFDLDPFDLICHIAFDAKPLTRKERADNVLKRDVFTKYGPQARAVLEALLEKYSDDGVISIDDPKILKINPFSGMGTEVELIRAFGKKNDYIRAVHEMQTALYEESA
jgi:type I restriction enzyme R subunit